MTRTDTATDGDSLAFLSDGGEMGARMRAMDWSATALGPAIAWQQSLKTVVRVMLNSRYPMFVWWGADLVNLYNDAYIPVLGQRHPASLGRPAAEIWSEIWNTLGAQVRVVLHEGRATWNEELLLIMERNGFPEETYFTYSYSPVPDDHGGIGGVFCACSEDTSRVLTQRRLRTLRSLSEQANQAKTAEAACEVAARTLAVNPHDLPFVALYLLDGERRATLAGLTGAVPDSAATPVVELDAPDTHWPFRQVIETARAVEVDRLVDRFGPLPGGAWPESPERALVLPMAKSGQSRLAGFVVAGVSPRLELNDDYRGFLGLLAGQVATAVANARAFEEEKRRAEALAELDRAKTVFFSNVSHEFRTPLTLMLGPIEELLARRKGQLTPAAAAHLEVVNRNALRLLRLVNSLLDFSRIEAGRVRASYQRTDLGRFTADLASVFRSACERAGLRLTVDCPPLDEDVYVDPDMWEKIVLNLISNAFKFTFSGEIAITLRRAGDRAELRVRDTGIGIAPEEMPKLFERFHRVENARGRTHEGSGIGLALVQELVRLHGGAISAESVPGAGTTFTVTVPFGAAHLPAGQIAPARHLAAATAATSFVEEALRWLPDSQPDDGGLLSEVHPSPSFGSQERARVGAERPRVLVADDNADMRQYLAGLLAERYRVELVPDGAAALAAAERERPDVVLTDIMMPHLDGFGLLRALRANALLRDVPVIVLSARAGEEAQVEGMQAGADDYLQKPFSARELLARISGHLQLARVRRDTNATLHRNSERLRLLWEAATVLLSSSDPDAMLRNLFSKIALHFELDAYFNYMVDETGQALRLVSCSGIPDESARAMAHLSFGEAMCGAVARERRPMVASGIQSSDEPGVQVLRSLGIRVYACSPLVAEGQLLGTLGFASRSRDTLEAEEVEFLRTISHYVTVAYERLRLLAELRESDRRKNEFLATLAHELRNPLAPLRNGLHVMKLATDDAESVARARTMMERQLHQMVRLIDDLMDISRITCGRLLLRRERVDLASVVHQAVETSRPLIDASGHELAVALPTAPVLVDADTTRLVQVLSNLLNNSAKFTERGGRIALLVRREGDGVTISVRDTGIGIPAPMVPKVFDLFTQVDRTLESANGGLGIGLSLARALIAMHGGSIEARSEGHGKGSEFLVRLPVAPPVAAGAEGDKSADAPAMALTRRRILVADDNRDAADSLAMLLRLMGNDTQTAHDGAEAVDLMAAFRPDVVLLDIGMPKLNGYAACRHIRELPWGKDVVLVACTGWGQEDDRRQSRDAGFDFHMVKPVDPVVLEKLLAGPPGATA